MTTTTSAARPWFRMYGLEWLTDPKVRRLPDSDRWRHVALLCIKSGGRLPASDEDVADEMRISLTEWESTKARFLERGLCDETNDIPAWSRRQFESDLSTERVRKHRQRKREEAKGETFHCNDHETLPTEQNRTDQRREEGRNPVPSAPASAPSSSKLGNAEEVAEVVEAWNACADAQGWQRSRGLEADRRKVASALKRREWREGDGHDVAGWRARLAFLEENGLSWVGRPGPHEKWKPTLQWFASDRSTASIIEAMDEGEQGTTTSGYPVACPACGAPGFPGCLCPGCSEAIPEEAHHAQAA